jgi:PST family polysaccharide transporter
VRSKAFAVLLGPAGFGLMGLYLSIVGVAEGLAGMGVNTAGVRQIAAAVGSGEATAIARTAQVLRRTSLALGLLGALLLLLLGGPIATLTFGNSQRAIPVALLSLAVLFRTVGAGQGALVQGLRRISDLAKSSVLGVGLGTLASIVLVYLFREQGIVPSVIAIELAFLLLSWWYSRRVLLEPVSLSRAELGRETWALLRLGFAFMTSGVLAMGAAYMIRIMVARALGLEAAGLFQSAWMVGGLYVGLVLQSLGADFYPRLTAAIRNPEEANRLVNEQAQVSMLLAGPGVLGTLVFAPLIVPLFYSSAFREGVDLLRWLCIGVTLRVITWPMGFIIVAHARQSVFLAVELAYTIAFMAFAWAGIRWAGLNGSGMAFFGSYVFHGLMLYPVVRWLTGFRWSTPNRRLGGAFLGVIGTVFAIRYLLPPWLATAVGAVAVVAMSFHSFRTLVHLVSADRLPAPIRRIVGWLGIRSAP